MAVIRFSSFVLVLLFIFYHARGSSIAQTYKAMEKTVVVVDKDMPDHYQSGLTNKGIYEDSPAAADEVRKLTKLGGRKMVLKRVLVKKMVNMEGLDKRRPQAPENSGATHFVGNCHNKGKGMMMKVECKLSTKRSLRPVKVQMAGYIPFNADYHIPRPHPPKNN